MEELEDFDNVFEFDPGFAYSEHTITKIVENRRLMENTLFIDRLLAALGIEKGLPGRCIFSREGTTNNFVRVGSVVYPPRSNRDLRDLHEQIIDSGSPDHHIYSVLYYILKDVPDREQQPAVTFAKSVYLPQKYRIFIDGIWLLDRGKFERALDFLTEPILIPTFPEEILYTLCKHPEQKDPSLPLLYYHTVSPAIRSRKVLETFFSVFAVVSVTEAFYFARKQFEPQHQQLFEQLIGSVLGGKEGEKRADRSVELVHLPLNEDEEAWFEEYLTDGMGRNLPGAKDTLIIRAIASRKTSDILKDGNDLGERKINGMDWSRVRDILKETSMAG